MSIIDDVTDCVILHYDARFHRNDIVSDTDIKTRFNFSGGAWAAEAEALSALDCISSLGVRIPQTSMNANTTPDSIARLVNGLVKAKKAKVAALSAKMKVTTAKKKKKTAAPQKPKEATRKKKKK